MTNFEVLIKSKNDLEDCFRENWRGHEAQKYAREAVAALEQMIRDVPIELLERKAGEE